MNYDSVYSGDNKSGICQCGHNWDDHHLQMVMNLDYFNHTNECYYPEECEYYGCNEYGGLDDQGKLHCGQYVDELGSEL